MFGFGRAASPRMRVSVVEADDQRSALRMLAELTQRSVLNPAILTTARQITNGIPARDDYAELEAIYDAVKSGTPAVRGLEKGLRYVSDPRMADAFMGPARILRNCKAGACGGDCDEAAALVVALTSALGFRSGLRAWGPKNCGGDYVHVYAVVGYPKHEPERVIALDTTVPDATVGWEPEDGEVLTAWLE